MAPVTANHSTCGRISHICKLSQTTTYYVYALQNSGQNLTAAATVSAVRIQ